MAVTASGGTKAAAVRRVFETWQRLHASPRAKLDGKRAARIRARLAEGFEVDELERALRGALHSDWLMGRDPKSDGKSWRDVHTLLRDASKVEELIGLWLDREGGGSETPEARADRERRASLLAKADADLTARRAKADVPIAGPPACQEGPARRGPLSRDLPAEKPAVNGRPGGRGSATLAMAFPAAAPKANPLDAEWAEYLAENPWGAQ